jgi:hypothetical protein
MRLASREALVMAATMMEDMTEMMAIVKMASTKEKAWVRRKGCLMV